MDLEVELFVIARRSDRRKTIAIACYGSDNKIHPSGTDTLRRQKISKEMVRPKALSQNLVPLIGLHSLPCKTLQVIHISVNSVFVRELNSCPNLELFVMQ